MSDEFDFDNEDGENENDSAGIKNLRKQFKALQRDLEAERAKNAAYIAKERAGSVAEILKAKGFAPDAAAFYTAEDFSEDAVGKWIESHGSAFARLAGEQSQQPSANDQNAQAAERVAGASYGTPPVQPVKNGTGQVIGDYTEIMHLIENTPDTREGYDELVKLGIFQPERRPGL